MRNKPSKGVPRTDMARKTKPLTWAEVSQPDRDKVIRDMRNTARTLKRDEDLLSKSENARAKRHAIALEAGATQLEALQRAEPKTLVDVFAREEVGDAFGEWASRHLGPDGEWEHLRTPAPYAKHQPNTTGRIVAKGRKWQLWAIGC